MTSSLTHSKLERAGFLLSYVKNNGLFVGITLAVTVAITTFYIQRLEVRHLRAKVEECRATTATLENSNKSLVRSLNTQNAAITQMQEISAAKIHAASAALVIAKAKASQYAQKAAQIEAQKKTRDDCADMRALVNEFVK